ncbi:MAG: phosphoenolpyruvate--protein phosphotransferase [Phycisphaerae bacterium]|nr:phosphoenolpyruvate--protein phosphotransferase [Phycisphaerae bacterium]
MVATGEAEQRWFAKAMTFLDCTFRCPLPSGLHARPASELADVAARFAADVELVNERTGAGANAKSVLAVIAIDVKEGDTCRVRAAGADAEAALAAISDFAANVLPTCDQLLPMPAAGTDVVLPRLLRKAEVQWLAGTPVSRGIGQGIVVMAGGLALSAELASEAARSRDEEEEKIRRAVAAVRGNLETKLDADSSAIEAGILRAHLSIAGDVTLKEKIAEFLSAGCSAGCAIVEAGAFFAAQLKRAESAYVRDRAIDVEDICHQLLEHIYDERFRAAGIELNEPSVVLATNLTPRQLLSLDRRLLKALVLEHAGTTSHTVILARSFGIPTLTGVADLRANLPVGHDAIVDANVGIVITEINALVRRYYERELRKLSRRQDYLAAHVQAPAVTRDGQRLEVAANVTTVDELAPAFEQGAEGIGLFRSEMLFMDRDAAPSEEEQLAVYTRAAQAADHRPVIIRTIDVGGDKPVPYLHLAQEANPFLGYRGVRIYREHQDVITTQLRAIIRASAFGSVRVMVPMVCSIDEVRWVKERIAEIQAELKNAGVAFDPAMRIGIMVEVPSVTFVLDQLCAEVDFFSIGTNDLMQYFLAVDRDNDKVARLYNARHPAFLRLLARIVEDAHRHNRWVGMCGEMARDTRNLPLLVGLGLDEISVATPDVLALKAAVTRLSAAECREVLAAALACRSITEVDAALAAFRGRGAAQGMIEPDLITVGSDSTSKEEVIKEIVDTFHATCRTDDPLTVEEAVWAREEIHSTAMGHGFAVPHCKTDSVTANSIGMVRLKQPIEWDSANDQPVECVILLAIRESDKDGTHMKAFSTLARKLMHEEFRARLLAAPDRDTVRACLAEEFE